MTSQAGLYTIKGITPEDTDVVMGFLRRTFFIYEPVNMGVNLCADENERCYELEDYCMSSMQSGFSLKAVDEEGNIVGVTISGPVPLKEADNGNDMRSQAARCKNPKFQRVLYLLAMREEKARLWEMFPEQEDVLEVKVAATDPAWGRKGIMTNLVKETEKLAKPQNLTMLRMDTSSAYSARVADKCGFTCVSRMLYKDCLMNGEVLTTPPQPHVEDRVNIKVL